MTNQVLAGKSIIITGIGPGFGRTLAEQAALLGGHVCMVSRTSGIMDEVSKTISASGGKSTSILADITSEEDCQRVAEHAESTFGSIDGLVNSAYNPGDIAPVTDIDLNSLSSAFEVTVIGTLKMIKACVPVMRRNGGGSVVNIGSQVARKVVDNQGGYSSTKAALSALTRQLAAEHGVDNIRFNTAAFGWTVSPPARAWLEQIEQQGGATVQDAIDQIAQGIALKRVPEEIECSQAALMLLSDYMKIVNGATLDINGGEYMCL